jgi:predicted peroxiredoxin
MASRSLVVKVTAGQDDQERCNQALTVAATAVASGLTVSLWLTGEAAWLALPDRASEVALPHAAPLSQLLGKVLDEGTVTVCSQCASRRGIGADDTLKGVRIAGASTFLAEIMADGAQALVY